MADKIFWHVIVALRSESAVTCGPITAELILIIFLLLLLIIIILILLTIFTIITIFNITVSTLDHESTLVSPPLCLPDSYSGLTIAPCSTSSP